MGGDTSYGSPGKVSLRISVKPYRESEGGGRGFVGVGDVYLRWENGVHSSLRSLKDKVNMEKARSVLGRGAGGVAATLWSPLLLGVWTLSWLVSSH